MFLPAHQPHHLDKVELYAKWVLDFQDYRSSSVNLSENFLCKGKNLPETGHVVKNISISG